jgi:hypothetical protein
MKIHNDLMKKNKPKRDPKTIKEKKWMALAIKYGNPKRAAQEVYAVSSDNSASQIAYENLRKLDMDKALEIHGITDAYLTAKAQLGLEEANRIHGTNDNFVETPDYSVRHKYLETLLRLKGHGQNKGDVNVNVDNRQQYYVALPKKDEKK